MYRQQLIRAWIALCLWFGFSACGQSLERADPSPSPEIEFKSNRSASFSIPSLNRNQIGIRIVKPDGEGPFPVLIGIAGGDGVYAFNQFEFSDRLRELGIVTVDFAPQGRGNSEGEDNFHGYVHQDDLKAVVDFVSGLPFVKGDHIGVISFSYGVALAAGALSRYPDMPVAFLIDWEGPSNPGRDLQRGIENNETWAINTLARLSGGEKITAEDYWNLRIHGGAISDEKYWAERDAAHFARGLPCPYLRVQFDRDHVQGTSKSAMMEIINAATKHSHQWTRCNDNPANIIYTEIELPKYHFHQYEAGEIPGLGIANQSVEEVLLGYIEEMFFLNPYEKPSQGFIPGHHNDAG